MYKIKMAGTKVWWVIIYGLVLSSILSFSGWIIPVNAQAPNVEVVIVPDTVELSTGEESEVVVIARNQSSFEITDLVLDTINISGLTVSIREGKSDSLTPQGAQSWTLKLTANQDMLESAKLPIFVHYSWVDEEESDPKTGIANAILEVTPPTVTEIESLIEVEVETASTSLMEYRPMMMYLTIKNKSNLPVEISGIAVTVPQGIAVTSQAGMPVLLAKGERRAFPYELVVKGNIWSGKHLAIFDITFQQDINQSQLVGSVVKTHEIEVGVLGESGIMAVLNLAAVGIPAFLILPGFLIITLLSVLSNKLEPKESSKAHLFLKELPKKTEPEFWLYAISLSILMTLLFQGGSLLRGYGLSDLFEVWLYSIAAAILIYVFFIGGGSLLIQGKKWWSTRKEMQITPTEKDDPVEILKKLKNMESSLILSRVELDDSRLKDHLFFVLEKEWQDKPEVWVTSSIIVRSKNKPSAKIQDEYKKDENIELDDFIYYLEKWLQQTDDATIEWEVCGPQRVKQELIKDKTKLGPGNLVRFE